VDILIDLAGHIANTRIVACPSNPPVLTRISPSVFNWPETIDYRITDGCGSDWPGENTTSRRFSGCRHRWCYRPARRAACPPPACATARHPSFNNYAKVEGQERGAAC
jgi:hypothetical protein